MALPNWPPDPLQSQNQGGNSARGLVFPPTHPSTVRCPGLVTGVPSFHPLLLEPLPAYAMQCNTPSFHEVSSPLYLSPFCPFYLPRSPAFWWWWLRHPGGAAIDSPRPLARRSLLTARLCIASRHVRLSPVPTAHHPSISRLPPFNYSPESVSDDASVLCSRGHQILAHLS